MSGSRAKALRDELAVLLRRSPTKVEFRAYKRTGGNLEEWVRKMRQAGYVNLIP